MSYRIKRFVSLIGAITLCFSTVGCGDKDLSRTIITSFSSVNDETIKDEATATKEIIISGETIDTDEMFTARDKEIGYDESTAINISLSDSASVCESKAVKIEDNIITLTESGTYVLSGTLSNGQIIIDADDQKIQLVLNNVNITNETSAAIFVASADKVFVTLKDGSENTLTTSGEYEESEYNIDGVIFSKDDITFNGSGTLSVTGKAGNAIVSKDDLKITNGNYILKSGNHGLEGKDSVRIASGNITIECGKDGIHSDNSEDEGKGYVYIEGGEITISANDDGIHADNELIINGGIIDVIESYEGLEGLSITINAGTINVVSSDDGLNAAGGNDASGFGGFQKGGFAPDSFGSNSDCMIEINGGLIYINAEGDGIDSNGNLTVNGGEIYVDGPTNSGNGALDYGDGAVAFINGGSIIAVGASGMAENFCEGSAQASALIILDNTVNEETVTLLDASGNALLSFSAKKSFNSIVISCDMLKEGETYTLKTDSESVTFEMTGLIFANKETGGFGNFHNGGFGGGNFKGREPGDFERGNFEGRKPGDFEGDNFEGKKPGNFEGGEMPVPPNMDTQKKDQDM